MLQSRGQAYWVHAWWHSNQTFCACRENNCPQCRMPMQSRRDCKKARVRMQPLLLTLLRCCCYNHQSCLLKSCLYNCTALVHHNGSHSCTCLPSHQSTHIRFHWTTIQQLCLAAKLAQQMRSKQTSKQHNFCDVCIRLCGSCRMASMTVC